MAQQIIIQGKAKLAGKISISGSKNAALPIIAATILANDEITLGNLPHLADIANMLNLLLDLGVKIDFKGYGSLENASGHNVTINPKNIDNLEANSDIVSKMRASILVLGPLLAKFSQAKIALPGGCAIGARPVDIHLMALEKLGAKFTIEKDYIIANAPDGLIANEITLPQISVGATENILMAACLAKGTSIIHNAAIEPEIIDLMNFLNFLGAEISLTGRSFTVIGKTALLANKHNVGDNSSELSKNDHNHNRHSQIKSGTELSPELKGAYKTYVTTERMDDNSSASFKNENVYNISADRIEAGSYAVAALATKGEVTLLKVKHDILDPIKPYLIACGAKITYIEDGIIIAYQETAKTARKDLNIITAPYPDFPTDMQAQLAVLLAITEGNATITENIFENRFMHIKELNKMGANIEISDNKLLIKGINNLAGAEVNASDLRASMALIIAALVAKGTTTINNIFHLDRGYENLEEKLSQCGIKIFRKYGFKR